MISQTTPAGLSPASRARSTAASVWPGAPEHAAQAGAEREDVSRLDEVVRRRARVDRDLDRARAVGRRDARGDALARLDRDREGRAERRLVVVASSAAARARRSAPRSGRGRSARAPCVAMKLTASGVANCAAMVRSPSFSRSASSTTTTNLPERMSSIASSMVAKARLTCRSASTSRGGSSRAAIVRAERCRDLRSAVSRRSRRSTYLASTSTSRLTSRPGASAPSVVASSVCGTSATANESSASSAIVSETPSTVIEPFSTQ